MDASASIASLPRLYQTHLVPLIFEPYARDLVGRLATRPVTRVLEIAAGTGVVTRSLASLLPESVSVVASDVNQAMFDQAIEAGTARPVEWRQADAMRLPFDDGAFDAVVCHFGVMFFPPTHPDSSLVSHTATTRARPSNEILQRAGSRRRPTSRPSRRAVGRAPHGSPRSPTARAAPLRNEIQSRGATRLSEVTEHAAEAIARRFGGGAVEGKIQAHVVTVEK